MVLVVWDGVAITTVLFVFVPTTIFNKKMYKNFVSREKLIIFAAYRQRVSRETTEY